MGNQHNAREFQKAIIVVHSNDERQNPSVKVGEKGGSLRKH